MAKERRYFEDIELGEEYLIPSRTITESDVLAYAGLTGDFEELHVSEAFARTTPFGTRVAHGLLGLAILDGLKTRTAIVTGVHTLASLGWTWDFPKPLHFGDTVHARLVVANKRRTARGTRGILFLQAEPINQAGADTTKAQQLGTRLDAIMAALPPIAGYKALLKRRRIIASDAVRSPLRQLTAAEAAGLDTALKEVGL